MLIFWSISVPDCQYSGIIQCYDYFVASRSPFFDQGALKVCDSSVVRGGQSFAPPFTGSADLKTCAAAPICAAREGTLCVGREYKDRMNWCVFPLVSGLNSWHPLSTISTVAAKETRGGQRVGARGRKNRARIEWAEFVPSLLTSALVEFDLCVLTRATFCDSLPSAVRCSNHAIHRSSRRPLRQF